MQSKRIRVTIFFVFTVVSAMNQSAWGQQSTSSGPNLTKPFCDVRPVLCADSFKHSYGEGNYVGHDEPAILFYSPRRGSGNNSSYFLTLPKDPPVLPTQTGTGGTFNFQLRATFWLGMALCDDQSFPNFTNKCVPNTDANIFDNPDPTAPDWIGHHPGSAYLEVQFYPPGWVLWPDGGNSCDPTKWCAAVSIASIQDNLSEFNNEDCLDAVGEEPLNFAFVTKNGNALDAASPFNYSLKKYTPTPSKTLLMNPGDHLFVRINDTPVGLRVTIDDLSTNASGSMTASKANGFAHPEFDPTATRCKEKPYAFHPMYSTSSEHTRVPWATHSYNVAFSDEIGHFEYCDLSGFSLVCPNGDDPPGDPNSDDVFCFGGDLSSLINIGGCFGSDFDFDGPAYGNNWLGTFLDAALDRSLHAQPVRFSSPLFRSGDNDELRNYDRVAFETDLPFIERQCDIFSGNNCTNPPTGASFYPIYSTAYSSALDSCVWQQGGPNIPGTINNFGGNSITEYGSILPLDYPVPAPTGSIPLFDNFRQILNINPCKVSQKLIEKGEDDSHEGDN